MKEKQATLRDVIRYLDAEVRLHAIELGVRGHERERQNLFRASDKLRECYTLIEDALAQGRGEERQSIKDAFVELVGELSWEQLTEDGECSAREQKVKKERIAFRWQNLEGMLGRKVSEDEASGWRHSHNDFDLPSYRR